MVLKQTKNFVHIEKTRLVVEPYLVIFVNIDNTAKFCKTNMSKNSLWVISGSSL